MKKYRRIIAALTFVLIFGLNLIGSATSELSDSEIIAKASNNTYSVKSFYNNIIVEDKKITLVLGYKCGHKNVESVKLKARKDVSNIEQAVYRRIQSDGR